MRSTLVVISAAAALGACAAPRSTESSGETESNIVGGQLDTGDPAIVELVQTVGDGVGTCTATFLSQTVLLTAAHCVVDEKNPKVLPKTATFKVMRAASSAAAKKSDIVAVPRANVHPHPGYDGNGAHDVAIVVLDRPVNVTPIAVGRTALMPSDVGKRVRIVGYGRNKRTGADASSVTRKRAITTATMSLQGDLVGIGASDGQACGGDSGGPALLTIDGVETLIATDDIAATTTNCAGGDLYQRTDLHLDFIDPFLGVSTTPPDFDDTGDPATTDPSSGSDPCVDPSSAASSDESMCSPAPTQAG